MKTQSQNSSICQTCIHVAECVHYQNSLAMGKPIWFCENFDDSTLPGAPERAAFDSKERATQSSMSDIEVIPGRMKGLCMNCRNRKSCLFPAVEGGVWYCEEYC